MVRVTSPVSATPQKLLDDIRGCRRCAAHLPLPPRPVLQFHPSARLLIAAQAPGRKVHETGVPARGRDGGTIALPHPSPRNNRWLKKNPWFERDVVPALRARVAQVLGA